jgi:hypothetical protein
MTQNKKLEILRSMTTKWTILLVLNFYKKREALNNLCLQRVALTQIMRNNNEKLKSSANHLSLAEIEDI